MIAAGIRTHILTTRPSEHKSDAPDRSAMETIEKVHSSDHAFEHAAPKLWALGKQAALMFLNLC